ncbi:MULTISPECIES: PKD domain-containing protein [unclassified Streptomyces]|uniref:PKD domain-containing protein n=1 Tax=unclassified Streptomyces TaxID=2593676 RepID=UPI002E1678B7|nr:MULTISPECIES: PKD domain-containing protein [unclassified Streptomyces]WSR24184.1 PKD domain-containing protein [Streptomyces sp. NBC_01205]
MGLIPGVAQADDPAAPGVSVPPVERAADEAGTFQSPAGHTVRTPQPGSGEDEATAQTAAAASNLEIAMSADITTARGIDLNVNLYNGVAVPHEVTIAWGDGTTDTATALGGEVLRHNRHTYPRPGDYTVTVTATDSVSKVRAVNELTFSTAGSFFVPHAPTRLLDTRAGTGATKAKVGAYSSVWVKIAGKGKVPAGVAAVVLNVTVTNATAAGHVSAYPAGSKRPESSNMNYVAGQTVPNQVIVPVSKDGYVELYNGGWNAVDLIADVTGYFDRSANDGYTSLNPVRFVDTREGLGAARGQVAGQGTFGVQITGKSGIPAGVSAVALNVTVTNPREAGHLTVFPSGQAAPTTSNLNFTAGQTVANSVIVPVGADGRINVRNGAWAGTDVIVDVVGYYGAGSKAAFTSTTPGLPEGGPWRLLDSRRWSGWPCLAGGYMPMDMDSGNRGGLPVEAYVLNVTVTSTSGPGFLSVAPDPYAMDAYRNGRPTPPPRPVSSALNWTAGKDVPNLVQAKPGPHEVIDLWNQSSREAHYIVDWFGQYDAY